MIIKGKNKKGEEIEIEETEVIKTIQQEYEAKLQEKDADIQKLKTKNEEEKEKLRQEHIKQIRTLLTGRKEVIEGKEFEEDEEDEEDKMLKNAKEFIKKM